MLPKKSARQGYAKAQVNLAILYRNGWGVKKDDAEALKWFEEAGKQDYRMQQEETRNRYHISWGLLQDLEEADKWLGRAKKSPMMNQRRNNGAEKRGDSQGAKEEFVRSIKVQMVFCLTVAMLFVCFQAMAEQEKGTKKKSAATQEKTENCVVSLVFTCFAMYDGDVQRNDKMRNVYDFMSMESGMLKIPCNRGREFEATVNDPVASDLPEGMGYAAYNKQLKGRLSPDEKKIEELTYTENRTLYRGKKPQQPPETMQTGNWRLKVRNIPLGNREANTGYTKAVYRISRVDIRRNEYVDIAPYIADASFEIIYPDGGKMFVKRFAPDKSTWKPSTGESIPIDAYLMLKHMIPGIYITLQSSADQDMTPK